MKKISGISGVSKGKNDLRNTGIYDLRRKSSETEYIDALEYKRILDEEMHPEKKREKLKQLISEAEKRLETKPNLPDSTQLLSETREAMASAATSVKKRVQVIDTDEIDTLHKSRKTLQSYSSGNESYRGNLGSDTTIYRKRMQDQLDNDKLKQESDKDALLKTQSSKISIWQRIKRIKKAFKNFFSTQKQEEKLEEMPLTVEDDRASQFRQQFVKAAPQIDLEEITKRRLENMKKSRTSDEIKE